MCRSGHQAKRLDLEERRDREGSVDSLPASVARVAHGFSEDTCWNWDWDKAISRVREIRRAKVSEVRWRWKQGRGGEAATDCLL